MSDDQPGRLGGSPERPARFFAGAEEFRGWLTANHDTATELWMGLYKKHVADRGLTWVDAVPEALCFGWIDSRAERVDENAMRQRWTPRRPGSVWSTVNINLVAQLTEQGRMHPAGLAAFAKRREDRSSIYSHERGDIELPPEYAARLAADARAATFLAAATATYRKIVTNWVVSAKQEATREKRMAQLIADSAAGQLIPSQRYGKEPAWAAKARKLLENP